MSDIAGLVARFPVLPKKELRYIWLDFCVCCMHGCVFKNSDGSRWLNDERFATPMINNRQAGHIFIGDFINYTTCGSWLFYQKV